MSKTRNNFSPPDLNLSEFCKGQFWPIHPPSFEEMYRRLGHENAAGGLAQFAINYQDGGVETELYDLMGDCAVIPISGPLMKRESFSFFFFGGTSYAYIQTAIKAAIEDDEVNSIVLNIDSPGGVVNGLAETVDLIFEARAEKPILAYADGMMASAAYEIGSAAGEIVAGSTAMVGSIGVLMVHEDWSKFNEKNGLDVTYLTAGKYKALGNPDEPLSDLARETFQAELDYLYTLFVETVARNRDEEPAKVLSDMADGRVFIGRQALDAGLIDSVGNFESAFDRAQALSNDGSLIFIAKGDNQMAKKEENNEITLAILEAQAPELLTQIKNDAFKAAAESAHAAGVKAERERVVEILAADADVVQTRKAIETGTEANAAFKMFYEAEKEKRASGLADMAAAAPESAGVEEPKNQATEKKTPAQERQAWRPAIGPVAS